MKVHRYGDSRIIKGWLKKNKVCKKYKKWKYKRNEELLGWGKIISHHQITRKDNIKNKGETIFEKKMSVSKIVTIIWSLSNWIAIFIKR